LAYRFIPAAALVGFGFRRELRGLGWRGVRAASIMGVFLTAGYMFQTFGLDRTSAAHAGFITGLFVVLTPVFGAIFMRHRAPLTVWGAALVSAFGLYLLSGTGSGGRVAGDLLVLGCAVSFAFHILTTDIAVRAGFDIGALLAVQLGVCGVVSLGVAGSSGDLVIPRDANVWIALVVTAVFASAIGFFVQTYAQQHASPARTALILASEPAFAGFFAYVLKGETLSAVGWLGAALILAAIFSVELVPYLRPPRPLPEG
ncbi:MAG: DMT family transporter, partial [Actinomycetota bacterium]|nr:DMT family transporter [Actinomycetota bacterium]